MTREVSRTWKQKRIGRRRHVGSQNTERLFTIYFCKIGDFELWCWKRLLRVPWIARRLNQSILREINPEYSLKGLMLKLKLQYLGHLMWKLTHWKRPWCWERLKAGGEGGDRGWDGWMASSTQWTWVWACSGSWWWTGNPGVLQSMGLEIVGQYWVTELNWLRSFSWP